MSGILPLPLTMYLVAPESDQCDFDEDGQVSADLFVWARDPSQAILLWRQYYEKDDEDDKVTGIRDRVRVFEIPIMGKHIAAAVAVPWADIHEYRATVQSFAQLKA